MSEDNQQAEANKEKGMAQAEGHAERDNPGWSDQAFTMLRKYLAESRGLPFLAEHAREWAKGQGLPSPPSERAWGAVIRRASVGGLIRFRGYAKTSNPNAHRTPAGVWERVTPGSVAESPATAKIERSIRPSEAGQTLGKLSGLARRARARQVSLGVV